MPSRAFHHKNRHGCLSCKQSRKKCDLRSPTCGRCARRRLVCVYDQASGSAAVTNPFSRPIIRQLATEWTTIEPSVQAILLLQIPHVGFEDVEMIYHFKTQEPTTLDNMPGVFGVRHLDLVERAPEYPYLLYGLITASALHSRSDTEPGNESAYLLLEEKACNFYQLALSTYRSRLGVIDENTCHSIFAFSVTLAGLTFGLLRRDRAGCRSNSLTYINGIIDIFDLLLGAVAIARESREWIPESLAEEPLLLPIRTTSANHIDFVENEAHHHLRLLPSRIHAAQSLDRSIKHQNELVDISVIYESAIPELRNVFFCLQRSEPNNILGVVGWPAFVGKSFASLLRQRHPAALVVLAYYGVALQTLDSIWWLHGIGSKVIQAVIEVTNGQYTDEWDRLLQWPTEKIRQPKLGSSTDIADLACFTDHLNIEDEYQEISRPFEVALVITQMKGITGPYHKSSNNDGNVD